MAKQVSLVGRKVISLAIISLVVATMALSTAWLPRAKPVLAQTPAVSIERVSIPSTEANHESWSVSISADGRYVAFESSATNLVAGDTNGVWDVFVHDRQTGQTTRVSVASGGTQSDNSSVDPSISADGRYVAFESSATNLIVGDTNGRADIFVHDRQTGQTTRVSVASDGTEANEDSELPSISADGRYVAFDSAADNLVASDNNSAFDVFVHDRQTGETTRVSATSDGAEGNSGSGYGSVSVDGRYVAFSSYATNLVAGDTNSAADAFVRDRQTGETTRVSVASNGTQGDDHSACVGMSADDRYVAFTSYATNLVVGDTNSAADAFVHDRQTGETFRVSVASDGTEGDIHSYADSISADGRYVAFYSWASNLVAGDTNGINDVFVHDRQTGETTRVSVASDGSEGNHESYDASISADGRYVAFDSGASNLVAGDTNGVYDVFVHDRQTEETTRVSLGWDGTEGSGASRYPSISADGRYVAFDSEAGNLAADDTNGFRDVFVHDRQTGQTAKVSVATGGTQSDNHSVYPSISADGRYVAFSSAATNLVPGDTNGCYDVFIHDRQTGQTARVSVASGGTQGNGDSAYTSISADGRYVAFSSAATNLVADDTNGTYDVFVHDRQTGQTTRVSVASGGAQGNSASGVPSISADGRYVAFFSYATNLVAGDGNGSLDVFVHDRQLGVTTRVSVNSDGTEGNSHSFIPSISADGRYVTFFSAATNLVADDTNGSYDVFVHDRQTRQTTRVSVASDGSQGDDDSTYSSISADGRYVAFASAATNLVTSDSNTVDDIFVHDRQTGQTARVSSDSAGTEGIGGSGYPGISADGRYVAFHSEASNLVPNDTNGASDVFLVSWRNPTLAYTPGSIDFGARYQNIKATQTLQIRNSGTGTLAYSLSETSPWCSVTPAAGDSSGEQDDVSVAIDTSGLSPGSYSCVILVASDGGLGIVPVYLSVQPAPAIAVVPESHDFGRVEIGSYSDRTFTVSNSGTANLIVGTVAGANPVAAPFSMVSDNCSGQTIAPGESRTLTVRFSPTVKGRFDDDFDIPSNDPGTPSATVTITGATPNMAPTAPVVAVTPDNPDTAATLLCSITTQSTDADGDAVTYTYQWYKDGMVQSALTNNAVGAAQTAKGQVWKCIVTPSDFMDTGSSAEDQVTIQNSAPAAAAVDVTPDGPDTAMDLVCVISTQSSDADDDTITYTYQWYKDGIVQHMLTTNTVLAAETFKGQVWKCEVTPSDGTVNGPSSEDQVTIQNSAPTAPVIDVTPDKPTTAADLVCSITTLSTDADGDSVTYTYQWYKDGVAQSTLATNTVGAAETAKGQVWKCVVTPSDGTASGPSAEDEVTVTGSTASLPAGAIAGTVIGTLAVVGAASFFWYRRSKKALPAS